MSFRRIFPFLMLLSLLLVSCSVAQPQPAPANTAPTEVPITRIPLAGPLADAKAEISGMTWYGNHLILLPQYPDRFQGGSDGAIFTLTREEILSFLDGSLPGPLEPRPIPLNARDINQYVQGFEGFEAIAFLGNQAFLTIETRTPDTESGYAGLLISGSIQEDLSEMRLFPIVMSVNLPQADLRNTSDEAILIANETVVTFYEANGKAVNPEPVAHVFDSALEPIGTMHFPNIEYRITDVTEPDDEGRFWAINYFYPQDKNLLPESDPVAVQWGEGPTHQESPVVERLLQFEFQKENIVLVETPPIQIHLLDNEEARNWEGLAELGDRGFLLVTDRFPETILAFVPRP